MLQRRCVGIQSKGPLKADVVIGVLMPFVTNTNMKRRVHFCIPVKHGSKVYNSMNSTL